MPWTKRNCDQCGREYPVNHLHWEKLCPVCRAAEQPAQPAPAPEATDEPDDEAQLAEVPVRLNQRSKKACIWPGCGVASDQSYCAEHRKQRSHEKEKDNAWRRLARFKNAAKWYLRRNPLCLWHLKANYPKKADHIHHVDPDPAKRWLLSGFRGLCASCHGVLTRRIKQQRLPIPWEVPNDPPTWS